MIPLPPWVAKALPFVLVALALIAGLAIFHRRAEQTGAAKVTAQVEQQHDARVAEARTDERTADAAAAAAGHLALAHTDAAIAALQTEKARINDALHALPPAQPGAALPVVPAGVLAAPVNALVDRANRAADAAEPAP